MRRDRDERDDVEVVLVDDPNAPSARTVELRSRGRGRELLLVVVAIAAVVGVGLIGDAGDDSATATPTTSTKRTTTTERGSTTSRAPTTTTTWPQHEIGTGALLPDVPTGLHLAALDGNGVVTIIDVGTGDRCRNRVATDGGWMVWNVPTVAGRLLVQTGAGSIGVDRSCGVHELGVNMEHGYPAAAGADRVWMGPHEGGALVEHRLPDGERTGRTVDLPRFGGPNAVVVGDRLVIGLQGEMTLVDPDTDERRDLGAGTPLTSHGNLVAVTICPKLECRLALIDVDTGSRRILRGVSPTAWDQPVFSADGRLLRVPVEGTSREQPASAVVDLETGSVRVIDVMLNGAQFTSDNRWLLGMVNGEIVAYSLVEQNVNVVLAPDLNAVQGFALL